MWLIASILLFAAFAANVAIGASTGSPLLSDVGEMLVLFAASALFVVAILKKEADRKKKEGG
ncbi:hypothetical protein [Silicimonas sp. MF1-12-2]|jgi:hypothetical protein|uniref:hypothetical protein n=1 Tax=Silicimonas sp. MF1-12-2 TaxID=3384793 RepID=UPI0039B4821A